MITETYLPLFPGFYSTFLEPEEGSEIEYINEQRQENELETEVSFDLLEFNYEEYKENVCRECCRILEDEVDIISKIEYEDIASPAYYNFTNDSVNCRITFDLDALKKFIYEHEEEFAAWIKARYASRDGFLSYHSNDYKDWLPLLDGEKDDNHKFGSMLTFYCEENDIDEYIYTEHGQSVSCTNYDEATTMEVLNGEFVDKDEYASQGLQYMREDLYRMSYEELRSYLESLGKVIIHEDLTKLRKLAVECINNHEISLI